MLKRVNSTAPKMEFSIKDFCSKCDQIGSFLRIWSHLPCKILNEKLHFLCNVKIFFNPFQANFVPPLINLMFSVILEHYYDMWPELVKETKSRVAVI